MSKKTVLVLATLIFLSAMASTSVGEIIYVDPNAMSESVVQWIKTFGGGNWPDFALSMRSVQQTFDGGYILAGHTDHGDPNMGDARLMKTDSSGNEQWNKTFGGSEAEFGFSVQQTFDGGYILAGVTRSFGVSNWDFWLIKTDPNGDEEWNKTFGGSYSEYAYSVQQTSDGGYILVGSTYSSGTGLADIWLVKTDPNGDEEWNKIFGGSDKEEAYSVQQTLDGGYILCGSTKSFGAGNWDFWLVKTDSSGNEQWNKTFGGSDLDYAYSVQQSSDGGYILCGGTKSFGAGNDDVWLVKTDSSGNEQWNKTFGGSSNDHAISVQQTSDDGYILAGNTGSFGTEHSNIWLIKTDSNGNKEWNRRLGGFDSDEVSCLQQTSDGGYVLCGYGDYPGSFGAEPGGSWLVKLASYSYKGTSWDNAYNYLQDALETAMAGDEIRVAQGIYKPDEWDGNILGEQKESFPLISGVALYGGYAGYGEPDPNARDIELYETILSGDLDGDDEPGFVNCIENSYNVVRAINADATTVFDGFTVTGGYGGYFQDYVGAGIYCKFDNPMITNCTFTSNYAWEGGGGMGNWESSPTVTNCTFTSSSTWGDGGGMCNWYSSPTVTNCTFSGNSALGELGNGGGMCNWYSSPTVTNCIFSGNSASGEFGGGGGMATGGAEDNPIITNCRFIANTAFGEHGGGMFIGNSTVTNCIFIRNSAADDGGGIYSYGDTILINCTFSGNEAERYGGGTYNRSSNSILINWILWGDTPDEIYVDSGIPIVTYSDVQGGWPGYGNIDVDPCFVDPDANDFHLKSAGWRWDKHWTHGTYWKGDTATSRCIDAGNPGSLLGGELLIIPDDPDQIEGENLRINMGAFGGTAEASMPPYDWALLGDLTNDGIIDYADLAGQAADWMTIASEQPGDLNRDGVVNGIDYALLANDWLEETSWFP